MELFKRIFENKGSIAPIAEKADRNFKMKTRNGVNIKNRLHYFAIGHTFKQIDTETMFEVMLDEDLKAKRPSKFLHLQRNSFTFYEELGNLIYNIRHLNSHYIHSFDVIKLDNIDSQIIAFLKESFELAVTEVFLNENKMILNDFLKSGNTEKKIVQYLCNKFYPNEEFQKEKRNEFLLKTKDEAIEELLFIKIDDDFDWELFGVHPVFRITKGNYLSFYGCLFLLSIFLYKSEANQLISKIKGFKKNETEKEQAKRKIFTFFSKRYSSQDSNAEENHLVKFRDLVQYLNHYPTVWNRELELESQFPAMTEQLKSNIIEIEINRSFPKYINDSRFLIYAKYQLWGKKHLGKTIEKDYIDAGFRASEIQQYEYEINTLPLIKDAELKIVELNALKKTNPSNSNRYEKEVRNLEFKLKGFRAENKINPIKTKLIERINKNLLIVSYGRNQDRFMDFATRYLAERNYFGVDTKFKCYKFYTTDEQNDYLEKQKEAVSKKEFDKLKYHQGKLVHYCTFDEHLKFYEDWDMPFVIENNAIHIAITFSNGIQKNVCIQRNLMIYFLEEALFDDSVEGKGKKLLDEYFSSHQLQFEGYKSILESSPTITVDQKTSFKKLLPKRLLHHYAPAVQNYLAPMSSLEKIIEETKLKEERYAKLLAKADKEGNKEDFIKRNKGKQFKLQFVRKACHLMFFRESYSKQVGEAGHHKRFHITKEEFNDFSRWMHSFDEVPSYKTYLSILFTQKGFFENKTFKTLFENSASLEALYKKVKKEFAEWIVENNENESKQDKFQLDNYKKFFESDMFFINVSHFITFLETSGKLNRNSNGIIVYKALENVQYLIESYYYKPQLEKSEYKTFGKLYNKLKTSKLEDALLYEMAIHYLKIENTIVHKAKTNVINILNQDIIFDIQNFQQKHLYNLSIPFNKIESFVELISHKKEQEGEFKSSFLANIIVYFEKVKNHKEVKNIYSSFISNGKQLSYHDLNSINNHIINSSAKFTKVALAMEEYFIMKDYKLIVNGNRISYNNIPELKGYFDEKTRNRAFHFGVPLNSYEVILSTIEKSFVNSEIKPLKPMKFGDLTQTQRLVSQALLETIHNDYFDFKEKDGTKKREKAKTRYFDEIVK